MKKTRDRKLSINRVIYVFRVAADCSLDPMDIINKGYILMVKNGAMVCKDVNGEIMGNAGRAWNPMKPQEVEQTGEINDAIVRAIQKTRNMLAAGIKDSSDLLPRLAQIKFNGQPILREDEPKPRYYVRANSYCANCKMPIPGTQTLTINSMGKVAHTGQFEPDPGIAKPHINGSKKWLHNECFTKDVEKPEEPEYQQTVCESDEANRYRELMEVLRDGDVSSDFARGAAWMYLKIQGKPNV